MSAIGDEMLMAYVDGELPGEVAADVARSLAADPELARRAESFRTSRALARDSLAGELADPVPEHLVAAILQRRGAGVAGPRRASWARLPLAAALVLSAGVAGYLIHGDPAPELLAAGPALTEALDAALTGQTVSRSGETATALGTFRVGDEVCRSFSVSGHGTSVRGLGCHDEAGWHITVAAADIQTDAFSPAAGAESVDTVLHALGADGPIGPADERALRESGWE